MTDDPLKGGKFREILEHVKLFEDQLQACIDAGTIKLDLKGPRAPSLLLGIAAKLIIENYKRQGRTSSDDLIHGISVFQGLFATWGAHFSRETQKGQMTAHKKGKH